MSRRARLDAELVRRGLARSREHAASLVAAGQVRVPGRATVKAATQVDAGEAIQVAEGRGRALRLPRWPQARRCARRLRATRPAGGRAALPRRGRVHRRLHRRAAAPGRRAGRLRRRRLRPARLVAADRRPRRGARPHQHPRPRRRPARPAGRARGRRPVVHLAAPRAAGPAAFVDARTPTSC